MTKDRKTPQYTQAELRKMVDAYLDVKATRASIASDNRSRVMRGIKHREELPDLPPCPGTWYAYDRDGTYIGCVLAFSSAEAFAAAEEAIEEAGLSDKVARVSKK